MITVFTIDDHGIVHAGLRTMLEATDDMRLVGASDTLDDATMAVRETAADIVMLDLFVGRSMAWGLCRRLVEAGSSTVVIFTGHGNAHLLAQAMECGARGYVLKSSALPHLPAILRGIAAGGQWLEPSLLREWRQARLRKQLFTDPEVEIIKRIAAGADNFQIADAMQISTYTVKYHLAKALKRSGERNRAGLVRRLMEDDLSHNV